jgi:hypothetical protein
MPFESSLPLVIGCLGAAVGAWVAWSRLQARWLLVVAGLLACGAVGCFAADWLVVTDREQLLDLFPRLARAAERQEVETLVAALDPDLRKLRAEVETVLRQVRPTEVTITDLDVAVDRGRQPPTAQADMIVRVTGNVIDRSTPGTALVKVIVWLHRKDGRWLVRDAEGEQYTPGRDR